MAVIATFLLPAAGAAPEAAGAEPAAGASAFFSAGEQAVKTNAAKTLKGRAA